MTTGELIKATRKKAHMTQEELGVKLGVSGSMIAQYETGKRNPKYETLKRIANALDVEWTEIVSTEDHDLKIFDALNEKLIENYSSSTGFSETDRELVKLGEFDALFTFGFLSDADKADALKDIKNFVEFTLSKYRSVLYQGAQQSPPPTPAGTAPRRRKARRGGLEWQIGVCHVSERNPHTPPLHRERVCPFFG